MSTEHTPGPWAWQTLGTNLMLMTSNRGKLIIMTTTGRKTKFQFARRTDNMGGILYDANRENIDTFPDARLIAAAPELLDACHSAANYISADADIERSEKRRGMATLLMEKLVAVLAKVEGGA